MFEQQNINPNNIFVSLIVSNEIPEHPVISPSSGAIFERRIIEKYIIENGCDPISGKEMRSEELIEVKGILFVLFAN